jgi:hypothetical protein
LDSPTPVADDTVELVDVREVPRDERAARAIPVAYIEKEQDDSWVAVDVGRVAEGFGLDIVDAASIVSGCPVFERIEEFVRVVICDARVPLVVGDVDVAKVTYRAECRADGVLTVRREVYRKEVPLTSDLETCWSAERRWR